MRLASPTSQLIFQPFRRFTYVTAHSTALPLLHLRRRLFTYVTWRAANAPMMMFNLYIQYIKESRVSCTIYKSRTAEPIWLKIGGEVA